MADIDLSNPPERYWHCQVRLEGDKRSDVVNDLTFDEVVKRIVEPWTTGREFTVAGKLVRRERVTKIRISYTSEPQLAFAQRHNQRMEASGIADLATDRRMLPVDKGTDVTDSLLFSGAAAAAALVPVGDTIYETVLTLCERLPKAAGVLATRSRKDKAPFEISDEYDVQDLLHALLRGYLKYSIQEDPLSKSAGAKSGRADISIEDHGILIEIKYVHGPGDQKRIFEEYSQDLVLYARWPHLKRLVFMIYNSGDLRDPEQFERLSGAVTMGDKVFDVRIVLA